MNTPKSNNIEYVKWLIIALTIIMLALVFRGPLSGFLDRTQCFNFEKGKVQFDLARGCEGSKAPGSSVDIGILRGSLSSEALYYLMSAGLRYERGSSGGGPRVEHNVRKSLEELEGAGLVEFEIGSDAELISGPRDDGGASMDGGEFADVTITKKGRVFLSEFGFCCEN